MSFLGSIGKDIGSFFQPKNIIPDITTAAGALFGGPIGAAAGNAIGDTITGQGVHPLNLAEAAGSAEIGDILGGGSANPLTALGDNFTNATGTLSSGLNSAESVLGLPASTAAVAPTAIGADSASAVAADPNLITDAAAGSTTPGTFLNPSAPVSTTPGTFLNPGATLPASTAVAPQGTLASIQSAIGSPLGKAATSLAPIALDVLKGSQITPQQKALQAQANQLNAQGDQLESYLQNGQLPPGEQAGINAALESAIASIKSDYASRGESGSSAEQEAIDQARQNAQTQTATMAQSLFSTGLSEVNSSSQIYDEIMQANVAQNKDLSSAITAAVGSMGGQQTKPQPIAA